MRIHFLLRCLFLAALISVLALCVILFRLRQIEAGQGEPSTLASQDTPVPDSQDTPIDLRVLRFRRLIEAIQLVETPQGQVRGDGGSALGPLQIYYAAWVDSRTPGCYQDCCDLRYSIIVAGNYWTRYCPLALEKMDEEVLARVWNGGPRGYEKESTLKYWHKINRVLMGMKLE